MVRLLKAYRPDGSTRGIWTDTTAAGFRKAGAMPRRASRVEVIEDPGPNQGRFHVDFTPISVIAGDPKLEVCLVNPFDSYTAAVMAEVIWLERNWVVK